MMPYLLRHDVIPWDVRDTMWYNTIKQETEEQEPNFPIATNFLRIGQKGSILLNFLSFFLFFFFLLVPQVHCSISAPRCAPPSRWRRSLLLNFLIQTWVKFLLLFLKSSDWKIDNFRFCQYFKLYNFQHFYWYFGRGGATCNMSKQPKLF